jgi:hypothetical protein
VNILKRNLNRQFVDINSKLKKKEPYHRPLTAFVEPAFHITYGILMVKVIVNIFRSFGVHRIPEVKK